MLLYDLPSAQLVELGRALFGDAGRRRIQRLPLTEAIIELVKDHEGVSIMSRWAMTPYELRDEVRLQPLVSPAAKRTWWAVYDESHYAANLLSELVSCMLSNDVFPGSSAPRLLTLA
ncbi:MAG: hypothetical protein GY822_12535 [Deltaproteobacteria bacterium]|nr:hypothetical protein [Deltaproteobacteria bacterium]